jgi:hypothetical protein
MQDPSYSAEDFIAAFEANWDSDRIGKYATYGCKTLRDQAEAFTRGIVVENPLGDDCEAGFVDESEPLWETCPRARTAVGQASCASRSSR